jgi:hypothetical protein
MHFQNKRYSNRHFGCDTVFSFLIFLSARSVMPERSVLGDGTKGEQRVVSNATRTYVLQKP